MMVNEVFNSEMRRMIRVRVRVSEQRVVMRLRNEGESMKGNQEHSVMMRRSDSGMVRDLA